MQSTDLIQPLAMSQPIANEGEKFNIPEDATGTERASVAEGFPEITMKSLDEGGKPPRGQDCNGMFYLSTDQKVFLQNGGVITFSQEVSDLIGGYPKNAILDYIDSADTYHKVQSLIDNNTNNFVENPALIDGVNWKEISFGGGGGLEVCDIGMALYVDETKGLRRYLNGQIVDINKNTQAFLNRLKQITALHPSLLCTEAEWQTAKTMSAFGQVGKFVFNYSGNEVVSVRIPRVVNIQGVFDLQNLGMTVSAGLPTHTHTRGSMNITGSIPVGCSSNDGSNVLTSYGSSSGALYGGSKSVTHNRLGSGTYDTAPVLNFNASRNWTGSTSTGNYSKTLATTNTVQQEAIQYPYFIQIATGQETENNIINDIELNNPYTLFDSKYSPNPLYNANWLASNGTYYAKAVYVTAYEGLVVEQNSSVTTGTTVDLPSGTKYTKRGLSVKLSTATDITDYDFVINTTDEMFRLPLLDGSENLPSLNKIVQTNNITISGQELVYTASQNCYVTLRTFGASTAGTTVVGGSNSRVVYTMSFGDTNEQNSDIIFLKKGQNIDLNATSGTCQYNLYVVSAQGNGTLYYYVGETIQNANLIDAGRIGEQLVDKVSRTGDTMTGALSVNTTDTIKFKMVNPNLDVTSTTAPSSKIGNHITTYDKNGNWVGYFACEHNTANNFVIGMGVSREINGARKEAGIQCKIGADGKITYSPVQLITTYVNGASGYRIWSDGYCEQWGETASATGNITISFLKTFANTNYYANVIQTEAANGSVERITSRTTTSMVVTLDAFSGSQPSNRKLWRACGYLASGQY